MGRCLGQDREAVPNPSDILKASLLLGLDRSRVHLSEVVASGAVPSGHCRCLIHLQLQQPQIS